MWEVGFILGQQEPCHSAPCGSDWATSWRRRRGHILLSSEGRSDPEVESQKIINISPNWVFSLWKPLPCYSLRKAKIFLLSWWKVGKRRRPRRSHAQLRKPKTISTCLFVKDVIRKTAYMPLWNKPLKARRPGMQRRCAIKTQRAAKRTEMSTRFVLAVYKINSYVFKWKNLPGTSDSSQIASHKRVSIEGRGNRVSKSYKHVQMEAWPEIWSLNVLEIWLGN